MVMLSDASELIGVEHVLGAIELSGAFLFFMIPSIILVVVIYKIHQARKRRKFNKNLEKQNKESAKQNNTRDSGEPTVINEFTVAQGLNGVPIEPTNKDKYESLALEFDETGSVKQHEE